MNWLIISDNEIDFDTVEKLLEENYENNVVYKTSSDSSELVNIYEILPVVDQVVILTEKLSTEIIFLTGFMCGSGGNIFSSASYDFENSKILYPLRTFETKEKLLENLANDSKKIKTEYSKVSAYKYLFDSGMPFTADYLGFNIEKENKDICQCYLDAGMDVNCRDKDGTPMLNVACRCESLDMVKWLLKKGSDINAVSVDRGYSALMDAVWKGNLEISQYLIKKGADVNLISKEGQSMLVLAVGSDNFELCKLLAENGADVDVADSMGMSAYGYAQLFKKEQIAAILEKYHKE